MNDQHSIIIPHHSDDGKYAQELQSQLAVLRHRPYNYEFVLVNERTEWTPQLFDQLRRGVCFLPLVSPSSNRTDNPLLHAVLEYTRYRFLLHKQQGVNMAYAIYCREIETNWQLSSFAEYINASARRPNYSPLDSPSDMYEAVKATNQWSHNSLVGLIPALTLQDPNPINLQRFLRQPVILSADEEPIPIAVLYEQEDRAYLQRAMNEIRVALECQYPRERLNIVAICTTGRGADEVGAILNQYPNVFPLLTTALVDNAFFEQLCVQAKVLSDHNPSQINLRSIRVEKVLAGHLRRRGVVNVINHNSDIKGSRNVDHLYANEIAQWIRKFVTQWVDGGMQRPYPVTIATPVDVARPAHAGAVAIVNQQRMVLLYDTENKSKLKKITRAIRTGLRQVEGVTMPLIEEVESRSIATEQQRDALLATTNIFFFLESTALVDNAMIEEMSREIDRRNAANPGTYLVLRVLVEVAQAKHLPFYKLQPISWKPFNQFSDSGSAAEHIGERSASGIIDFLQGNHVS